MKGLAIGLALCVLLLGVQSSGAPWVGGGRFLSPQWLAIGLFWFCLVARDWQALLAGWAAGWLLEAASATPPGLAVATTASGACAAVWLRRWVRHDTFIPSWLFAAAFTAALLGAQGVWFWIASSARAWPVMTAAAAGAAASAAWGAPLVWLLQKVAGPHLAAGDEEAFAR